MREKLPIGVRPSVGDQTDITVGLPFEIVELESAISMPRSGVAILHSSISPPRRKLAAARWLLRQLQEHRSSEGAALMFLECLVTTLRSATFALQKMGSAIDGFSAWYDAKREEMRADPQLRWLVGVRNAAEKEGLVLAEYGPRAVFRIHRDGVCTAEAGDPTFQIDGYESTNLLTDLESAVEKLSAVVEEAHTTFFQEYGRKQMRYSVEYLREKPDGSWEHFDVSDRNHSVVSRPRRG